MEVRRASWGSGKSLSLLIAALAALSGIAAPARGQNRNATPADDTANVLYLDTIIAGPLTHQMGYERFKTGLVMMNGIRYPHSLMVGVMNNSQPTTRYAAVTFPLDGHFTRFQATIGRDDVEQSFGPAYCVFEIWGDGKRLYRSDAVRSDLTDVFTDSPRPKRSTPLDIDLPVRGIQSLRLLVRYDLDFSQQARYVNRACGCVWGSARVSFSDADVANDAPDPGAAGQESALRATLRRAALHLLTGIGKTGKDLTGQPPYHLAVAPLVVDFGFANSPLRLGASELDMRTMLAQTLYGFHHEGNPLATPLADADTAAINTALASSSSTRNDPAAVAALGRQAHADLLVFGAIRPQGQVWAVNLQMVETRHGRAVQKVSLPITADTPAQDITPP